MSLREQHVGRQLAIRLNISRPNVKPAHFKLRMSPRCLEGTPAGVKIRVAFDESDDCFARLRNYCDERKLKSLVWLYRDPPAQAKDRVEHKTNPIC